MNTSNKPGAAGEARKGFTLYCFSPPVMLATMVIESGLAAYTLGRYRRGIFGKVVAVTLLVLAAFQLSEYQICTNRQSMFWLRFGLVAITLLPILGLYLVSLISHKQHFLRFGYGIGLASAVFIIVAPQNVIHSACGGNYVIFSGPEELFRFYAAYYFGSLLLGIWESIEAEHASRSERVREVLKWLVIGYLSFMLPMGITYAVYAPARQAVASIMCGFAVILAFILTFRITPQYYQHSPAGKAR